MARLRRWIGGSVMAVLVIALACAVPTARAQQEGKADAKPASADKAVGDKSPAGSSVKDRQEAKDRQDKGSKAKQEKREIRQGERTEIEARCLAFAREHHPELADLLERLAAMDETQFRKAIADLYRDVDRLDKLREKTPSRHGGELKRWKIESRIRLLAARGAMSDSPEREAELRGAVAERFDLKAAQLAEEKAQLESRLRKIDESLADLSKDRDKQIDTEVARLRKSAGTVTAARKNPGSQPGKTVARDAKKSSDSSAGVSAKDRAIDKSKGSAEQKVPK